VAEASVAEAPVAEAPVAGTLSVELPAGPAIGIETAFAVEATPVAETAFAAVAQSAVDTVLAAEAVFAARSRGRTRLRFAAPVDSDPAHHSDSCPEMKREKAKKIQKECNLLQ
jgi:hypothetical protein